jgi:hypothetical protein
MSGHQLYEVSITIAVVVRATSEQEALRIGADQWVNEVVSESDFDVERLHTLPFGWDENAEVYGDHEGDLTVEQCVAAGEAPEYSKHLASFTARKAVQS